MMSTAQDKSAMRINVDTVIEVTRQVGVLRRRRLDIAEKWMVDGVIEPPLDEAAVALELWFGQAQFRRRLSAWRPRPQGNIDCSETARRQHWGWSFGA